jgi:nitrogen fixation protein FixH
MQVLSYIPSWNSLIMFLGYTTFVSMVLMAAYIAGIEVYRRINAKNRKAQRAQQALNEAREIIQKSGVHIRIHSSYLPSEN